MPRRVRTAPKRYIPDQDSAKQKPKSQQHQLPRAPSYASSVVSRGHSRSVSVEPSVEPHRIRGRTVDVDPVPVPHVLREIHQLQSTTKLQIPKLPFGRLIREVLINYSGFGKNYRITAECLECLQEAAEIFMVQLFEDSNRCCQHRDRVILMPKDMKLALFLREKWR